MRTLKIILLVLLLPFISKAQTVRVQLSKQLIIPNQAFSIQYVIEDLKPGDEVIYPDFKNFRSTGPYINSGTVPDGNITKTTRNYQFTLVALKPGHFIIEGPKIKTHNRVIRTPHTPVDVLPASQALQKNIEIGSDYFLRPGEDPDEKINKNLFMRVSVSKKDCYVGEPILATFKLYSRLSSRSDIVKNPGFYGFTVQDIINLNDKYVSTETVNGRPFDVHTVRSVQLYPLQAGSFVIDPMEVANKVEFSRNAVFKKSEQEITEGVYENEDNKRSPSDDTIRINKNISTEKIFIHVKPLPETKKPVAFNGATGNFSIRASVEKKELAKNEEGVFIVMIKGKGNFTQLSTPVIAWPAGIESFDPVVKDSLDKNQVPLRGLRTYRFPFISSKADNYLIPAVSFSFFDPDSNGYKTVGTEPVDLKISNSEKKSAPQKEGTAFTEKSDVKSLWIYCGVAFVVLLIIALQFRKPKKQQPEKEPGLEKQPAISIEQLLQPAQFSLVAGDGQFYSLLQKSILDFLTDRFHLSGIHMSKNFLSRTMKEKNIDERVCNNILGILAECEAAIFTKAQLSHDKQQLLDNARTAMDQIKE